MSFHSQLEQKIMLKEAALNLSKTLKSQGKTLVFTNGCFDLLHPGHVDYLCQARDLGDYLILGLNTDASVRKLDKAPERPINGELARAKVLAGLACVDAIILFEEVTPLELISFLMPDILVKGGDYTPENIVGADLVKTNGGKVVTIQMVNGYSTSNTINKIKAN